MKQASQLFNVIIGNTIIVKGIYASIIEYISLTHNNQNIQNQSTTVKLKTTNFQTRIPLLINIYRRTTNINPN